MRGARFGHSRATCAAMAAAAAAPATGGKEFGKITLLGNPGVGKTCIVKKFCFNKFQEAYKVTLGADFGTKQIAVDGVVATAQVWDTAGQERFNSLGAAFYRGSDACMLVYDVTDPRTLDALAGWQRTFIEKANVDPDGFPIIVVGNKSDFPASDHKVSEEDGRKWAEAHGCIGHFQVRARPPAPAPRAPRNRSRRVRTTPGEARARPRSKGLRARPAARPPRAWAAAQ